MERGPGADFSLRFLPGSQVSSLSARALDANFARHAALRFAAILPPDSIPLSGFTFKLDGKSYGVRKFDPLEGVLTVAVGRNWRTP